MLFSEEIRFQGIPKQRLLQESGLGYFFFFKLQKARKKKFHHYQEIKEANYQHALRLNIAC